MARSDRNNLLRPYELFKALTDVYQRSDHCGYEGL